MVLFLERYFLLFPKMNEVSWSPWVWQSESRTCHEANVRPGVDKQVISFPHFPVGLCYITKFSEKLKKQTGRRLKFQLKNHTFDNMDYEHKQTAPELKLSADRDLVPWSNLKVHHSIFLFKQWLEWLHVMWRGSLILTNSQRIITRLLFPSALHSILASFYSVLMLDRLSPCDFRLLLLKTTVSWGQKQWQ